VLLAVFRPRRLSPWSPVLVAVGAILPVVRLDLLPLTGVLMAVGLAPLGWGLVRGARMIGPSPVAHRYVTPRGG
jgi:hypothetical protein